MKFDGHPGGVPSVTLSGFRQNTLCFVARPRIFRGRTVSRRIFVPKKNGSHGSNGVNGAHAADGGGRDQRKVRVAIIGVGNCASSLVQGVTYYQNAPENERVPGLMHVNLGGYHISDIEFSA